MESLPKHPKQADILVYTKDYCPYCVAAKNFLTQKGVAYTEVAPPNRLGYKTLADFIPGVAPYEVATVVELKATTEGVKLTITFDAMHDDIWTERARAGHESQMRKLDALFAAERKASHS